MRTDADRYVEVQGARMPALGHGTWQLEGSECVEAVVDALGVGYRHIDTAQAYGNEVEVGTGVRRSGVDREDVWVTTKVWWENLAYDDCVRSARTSLDRLDVGWIDLLLIHWPSPERDVEEPLEAMTALLDSDEVRNIGVSNFTPTLLEEAAARAPIVCNQVEYHPFLAQDELLQAAAGHDVALTAYSPLAQGRAAADPTLREIGIGHGKSAAQVALRWLLQQPLVAAIPRTADVAHRRDNIEVFDFELCDEEMERIRGLDEGLRLIDPEFAPEWERSGASAK